MRLPIDPLLRSFFLSFLLFCLPNCSVLAPGAQAFTTRVHIALAEDIRYELIRSNDGTVALKGGGGRVQLSAQDSRAIIEQPLSFRAGAIGPDNFVFPAMTDPTHALGVAPFDQCQMLYDGALTDEERAYALGCFLHGSTDAIAHHLVNWLTGETFTLTPITADREHDWDNVIRHVVAESLIQEAMRAARPEVFAAERMYHAIPDGFVERMYLHTDSPIWEIAANHAKSQFDGVKAAHPDWTLPDQMAATDLAPAEHMILMPYYLQQIDTMVDELRQYVLAEIQRYQDPADQDGARLLVEAGPDGILATWDDVTDCWSSCPTLYGTYFTYIGLLLPRQDAAGRPLPSAFDKIAEKFRTDLFQLIPAYLQTIENLSALLNTPIRAGDDGGFNLDPAAARSAAQPMEDWARTITTVDYEGAVRAVVPIWMTDLEATMQRLGISISIGSVLQALYQPILDEIRAGIEVRVIGTAQTYLSDFLLEYITRRDSVEAEFLLHLADATAADLNASMLDHIYDSGLYIHSFNITAATFAQHELVLPDGIDWGGWGPASFDASYTPNWMQAGVCDYLSEQIFPLGTDLASLLTVWTSNGVFPARVTTNAPIECHDGELNSFASAPGPKSCVLKNMAELLVEPLGSLSRAYPPQMTDKKLDCRNILVPGLLGPPDPKPVVDPDPVIEDPDTDGCDSCNQASESNNTTSSILVLVALGMGMGIKRRNR